MKNKENIMKTKPIRKNKKHTPKNDVGFGTKKMALDDMGVHNEDFDLLSEEFVNNIIDEVLEEQFEDLEDIIDE